MTIHTSRTIMYDELFNVMDKAYGAEDYFSRMANNVFNKKTESSIKKTSNYLKQLYSFESNNVKFKCLEDYWYRSEFDQSLFALLFAVSKDYLLSESIEFVKSVKYGEMASIEGFEECIAKCHPNRFSPKTLRSIAGNVASSWKQGRYVQGARKNTRTKRTPTYHAVSFAFCMAYLDEYRGDYLFDHPSVKALDCDKGEIMVLLKEASIRDLLDFNKSGASLVVSFENYLTKNLHV